MGIGFPTKQEQEGLPPLDQSVTGELAAEASRGDGNRKKVRFTFMFQAN